MITKIIDKDALEPLLWVIINALYVEGNWSKPFIPQTTRTNNFTKVDGKGVKAQMMTKEDNFKYAETKYGKAIELPLYQSEFALVALLPNENTEFAQTGDPGASFSPELWAEVLERVGAADYEKGTLTMPKFKYDYGYQMDPGASLTKAVGLQPIFENNADFSAMGTKDSVPSKVALIIQKTAIEVDENGLKAAAVTLVGGAERTSAPRPPTFNLQLDRPFLYTIVDRQTGAVLFLGSVVDPTK